MSNLPSKPLLIHIGTHKTASTSFQHYLGDYREHYIENGYAIVPIDDARVAACLAVRDQLPIPPQQKLLIAEPNRTHLEKNFRDRMLAFEQRNQDNCVVLSCEHLSYFRTVEEVDRLLGFFERKREIFVFLVLRDKHDFLRSYRAQIEKTGHGTVWNDKQSPYYCGEDSWLIDYEAMQAPWITRADEFKSLRYEGSDVVTDLINAMGLPDFRDGKMYRRNVSSSRFKMRTVAILRQLQLYSSARVLYTFFSSVLRR